MSDHRIIALLDRPSPRSFGMVPFVLLARGFKGRPAWRLEARDVEELVLDRHALRVDATVPDPIDDDTVAGWLGRQFLQEAGSIPAGVPWERRRPAADDGHFWLAQRADLYQTLERWVHEAACDVFERDDARLAKLMIWVRPDSAVTRAALWSTKKTEEERKERIAWWVRLERDAGRPTTEAEMTERLRHIREEYLGASSGRLARPPGPRAAGGDSPGAEPDPEGYGPGRSDAR
jgi:hypothetical protein